MRASIKEIFLGLKLDMRNAFITICVLTFCIIIIPLFCIDKQRIRMISQTGTLGETLRTSVGFKVLQGVTIGSALPMLIDIVLDKIFKISNIDITRLSLPQFVSTISAAIYLLTNDQYYTTYVFTCFLGMKMLVPSSLIFYSLSQGAIASKFNLRQWVFLLPILFTAIARVIISYSLLFPEYTILLTLVTMCFIIGSISFFLVLAYWLYNFWRQYRVDSVLGLAETEELSYALGLVLFFFCYVAVSLTFNTQKNWLNTTETVLISLNLIQTILVVWLTVLPGRLLRKVAEVPVFDMIILFVSLINLLLNL